MAKNNILVAISILAIAVAAVLIYRSLSDAPKRFELGPYQALGYGAAEATAKTLGKKGRVVVVAPDTSQSPNPAVDGELSAFEESLKQSGLSLAACVRFTLSAQERMGTGGAIPGDQLIQALRSHPNVGAVVLFCAFPPLTAPDHEVLKQSGAKIVVASGYLPGYRKLLEAQAIHLAIVPRFDRSAPPAKIPQTLREWFDSQFLVITPDNTATLPY